MNYRQGDVVIKPTTIKREYEKSDDFNGVLAEGEATGHTHRVIRGQVEMYKTMMGLMAIKVLSEFATIGHEEHEDIKLPMGEYEVMLQREYDWTEGVRRVLD